MTPKGCAIGACIMSKEVLLIGRHDSFQRRCTINRKACMQYVKGVHDTGQSGCINNRKTCK